MNDWIVLLKLSGLFLLLFAIAEILYHKAKVKADYTRNLVHAGTGLLTLLFPVCFTHQWQVTLICTAFMLILIASMRYKFLPSINAVSRKTAGSVLYPVIVTGIFAFYGWMSHRQMPVHNTLFFYLPILTMAIADPVAALAGHYWGKKTGGKTMAGSVAFFISAFAISGLLFLWLGNVGAGKWLLFSLLIALITMVAERISNKGWDNFTIPAAAALMLYLMI